MLVIYPFTMKQFYKRFCITIGLVCAVIGFSYGQSAPPSTISGATLRTWLKTNWYDGQHSSLGYDAARRAMFNTVDRASDNRVYCVYTGHYVTAANSSYIPPINTEHTVPQSFFAESAVPKADLHHLFPTQEDANSLRSNNVFADIPDNTTTTWLRSISNTYTTQSTIPTSNINLYSEFTTAGNNAFEVPEAHKGNCARAIFYFYTMYPTIAGSITGVADPDVLYQWHLNDPVDATEITRNNRVETAQGNRNPYVDYPELVGRAWGYATPTCTDPTTQAVITSFTATGTSTATINWTNGNGTTRLVVVKPNSDFSIGPADLTAYIASQTYGSGTALGGGFVVYNGSGTSVTITSGLSAGTTYYARVFEYNCSGTTAQYLSTISGGASSATTSSCTAPSTQATSSAASGATSSQFTLNWTNGNGAARIVLVRAGSAVNGTPVNGTTYSAPSSTTDYRTGTQIGTGNYVAYVGTANTATIRGLDASNTYHVAIFEYNCSGATIVYNSTLAAGNVANITTIAPSAGGAGNDLIFSEYIEGSSNNKYIEITNTSNATIDLSDYKLRLFANGGATATADITLSGTLAAGASKVYRNTSATIFTGAAEISNAANFNGDDALGLFKISTNAYVDIFGQIGCDPGVSWAAGGNTTVDKTWRRNSSVCAGLVSNSEASCGFSTLGTQWTAFTLDDISNLGSHTFSCATTCTAPTTGVSNLAANPTGCGVNLSWTRGNGNAVIVVALPTGGTATPVSGTAYTGNANYASAATLGDGKIVYQGTGTSANVTNLTCATAFDFVVYEYKTTSNCYRTTGTSVTANSLAIDPIGTTTLTGVISSATSISLAADFTGNSSILVLQKVGSAPTFVPSDGATYTVGQTVADGSTVVAISTASSINLTGLTAGTTYFYTGFSYNGATTTSNFEATGTTAISITPNTIAISPSIGTICQNTGTTTSSFSIPVTMAAAPNAGNQYIAELSNASGSFTSPTTILTVTSTAATYTFANVNVANSIATGTGYKVRVRSTNPALTSAESSNFSIVSSPSVVTGVAVTSTAVANFQLSWAVPTTCFDEVLVVGGTAAIAATPTGDGSAYTANASLNPGTGTSLGNGKVVYKGTGNSVVIAVANNTTYHFAVYTRLGTAWSEAVTTSALASDAIGQAPASGDIIFTQVDHDLFGSDLIISEYVEGSSNNKYIEVFNPTNATVDLSTYALKFYANGGATSSQTTAMSGNLLPGKVAVFRNSSAVLTLPSGVTAANNSAVQYNGDDAIEIGKGASFATSVDIFGNIGCDPGTAWTSGSFSTLDKTLVRKISVVNGVTTDPTNAPCSFPTLGTEWDQSNVDVVSNLGLHKAEVSRRTKVQLLTLKKMNLNSIKLTDRGLCSAGSFLDITNDALITFPSSGLESVPAGTFVNIIWNATGTNDLNASDGVITIYGGIANASNLNQNVGDQLILYSGTENLLTTCATTASTPTFLAGFNFGLNNWKTSNGSVTEQSNSYAPSAGLNLNIGNSNANIANDYRFTGAVSGTSTDIKATSSSGTLNTANWSLTENTDGLFTTKDIKMAAPVYSSGTATVTGITKTSAIIDFSGVTFSGIEGSPRYVVVLHTTTTGTPVDRYTSYAANAAYGSAPLVKTAITGTPTSSESDLVSGLTLTNGAGRIVYLGEDKLVTVTGLTKNTSYTYSIHAFNGNTWTAAYSAKNANAGGSFTTLNPTISLAVNGNTVAANGNVNFGTVVAGNSQTFTLRISANGNANLESVAITAVPGSFIAPSSTVNAGQFTDVVFTLTPSVGNNSYSINVASDATNASPYSIGISFTGITSNSSEVLVTASGYSSNINYSAYQSATVTNLNSVPVLNFSITDDVITAGSDNLSTIINSILIQSNNVAAIRDAGIYVGSTKIGSLTSKDDINNRLIFTGLAHSVPDNNTNSFALKVTFNTTVTDNEQLSFSFHSIVASSAGSGIAAYSGTTPITGDINRLEVTASVLSFKNTITATPSDGQSLVNFQLYAVDGFGNTDLDYEQPVSLSLLPNTTDALMPSGLSIESGMLSLNGASNIPVYENITGLQIQATSGSFTITSSAFNTSFTEYTIIEKRTIAGGNYTDVIWESVLANAPFATSTSGKYGRVRKASETAYDEVIQHAVSFTGSAIAGKVIVENNGAFTVSNATTLSQNLEVKAGGSLIAKAAITKANGSQIILDNGSLFEVDMPSATLTQVRTNLDANLVPSIGSTVYLKNVPAQTWVAQDMVTRNIGSSIACFDNLRVRAANGVVTLGAVNKNIASGSLVIDNANDTVYLSASSAGTTQTQEVKRLEVLGKFSLSTSTQTTDSLVLNADTLVIGNNALFTKKHPNTKAEIFVSGPLTFGSSATIKGEGSDNLRLRLMGAPTLQSIDIATTLGSNTTLWIDEANAQLSRNLVLAESAKCKLTGALNTSSYSVSGAGTFEIATDGTIIFGAATGTTGIATAIQTANKSYSNNANYRFVGDGNTGAEFPKRVKSLQIMGATNGLVSLTDSLVVTDNLVLGGGKLKLNGGRLILGENGVPATVVQTGDSAQNYIDASEYSVKLALNTEEPEMSLPLGTSAHYLPIKVSLNNVVAQANPFLIAEVKGQVLPSLVAESPNHYLNNYWNIDPINFTTTSYSVRLSYPTARVTGNSSYLIPYKFNNTSGLLRAGLNNYTRTTTGNYQTLTWNGLTSFSSFGAGDGEDLLPVTFSGFTAKLRNGAALLQWSTLSELNNQGFAIERSTDGITFSKMGFVKGAGTTNAKMQYQYTDYGFNGSAYYRLVQTDYDGKTYTTAPQYLNADATGFVVEIETNPAENISLLASYGNEKVSISVINNMGTQVFASEGKFERVATALKIASAKYAIGMYVVRVNSAYQTNSLKVILKVNH